MPSEFVDAIEAPLRDLGFSKYQRKVLDISGKPAGTPANELGVAELQKVQACWQNDQLTPQAMVVGMSTSSAPRAEHLNKECQARLHRLIHLYALAVVIMGSARAAEAWLLKPRKQLDGNSAAAILGSDRYTLRAQEILMAFAEGYSF
mgnify:CR=1 FL=1